MNQVVRIVIACVAFITFAPSASAEVTYRYTGSAFTLFSCGPNPSNNDTQLCPTPAPANPLTSYTPSDFVTITLTFDDPLPPNFPAQVVHNRPGFHLTMNDGHQTLTEADAVDLAPMVGTDASGQIVSWAFDIHTSDPSYHAIKSLNLGGFFEDTGILACCDPAVSGNLAVSHVRGTWNSPAACEIHMSQATYNVGQQVVATIFKFSNTGTGPVPVEIKAWMRVPGVGAAIPILRAGADGSVVFPAGLHANLGPATLFTVTNQMPSGLYEFNCRLVDPATAKLQSEDHNSFFVVAFP